MLKKKKKIGGPYDKKIKEKKHSIQLETSNGNQKEKPRTKKKHFRFVREPQNQKKIEKRTFGRDWQFLEKFLEHENSKTIPVDADCWRPSARLNLATRRTRRSEEIINNRNDLFLFNFFWPDTTKKNKNRKKKKPRHSTRPRRPFRCTWTNQLDVTQSRLVLLSSLRSRSINQTR